MNEWEQAPVVGAEGKPDWQSAPVVGKTAAPTPEDKPSLLSRVAGGASEIVGGMYEPAAAMVSGAVAKPVSEIAGMGAIPLHAAGLMKTDPKQVQESVQRGMTYEPKTQAGKAQMALPELLGKILSWATESGSQIGAPPKEQQGPGESVARGGLRELLTQLPQFAGLMAPGAAGAVGGAMQSGAKGLMRSALKPSTTKGVAAGDTAVQTLLDEGLNVTRGGMEKLHDRIDVRNDKITALIENSPAVIDKEAVASRLKDTIKTFEKQVDKAPDIQAIQGVWDRFLADKDIADLIPVTQAQELKTGTYQRLKGKYGEQGEASTEAQKALARGLKEEIAKAVPEVRPLNAEESKLLNALSLVERRVLASANKNPIGLGLLTTSPSKMLAYMADRSELFKSLTARMLNTTGGGVAAAGAAGPPLGMALPSQAQQPNQLTNPPQQ